ncbi:unnamed protein product [Oikopleura dioica]|uniref:BTB domain-containing protein n=1 Tax=Oikopleura dioica TaxID=34765 RepID=E4YH26_OIKDI|nr:unnamed protein product [Oikopleura dioica]
MLFQYEYQFFRSQKCCNLGFYKHKFSDVIQLPKNTVVVHASFSKFHGICLDSAGRVYSWGVQSNQKGRLGYAAPPAVLNPKRIVFPEAVKISYVATSDNHSVLISDNGRAYVFGSNSHGQLGLGGDTQFVESPRCVHVMNRKTKVQNFTKAAAGIFHSALINGNDVYTCGRDVGQLGHGLINKKYDVFTKIASLQDCGEITKVVSTDAAIAVLASRTIDSQSDRKSGDVWLIENGDSRKVLKVDGIIEISISGGRTKKSSDCAWRSSEPCIVILSRIQAAKNRQYGYIHIWKPSFGFFNPRTIQFSHPPPNIFPIVSASIFECGEKILLAGNDGQCYMAKFSREKVEKYDSAYVEKRVKENPKSICFYIQAEIKDPKQVELYDLERVHGASHVSKVFAEENGRTFALLRALPKVVKIIIQINLKSREDISQEDIWKVYHNEPISSGALKSEPVELRRLPEDVTIKCIDGEIKANNLVLLARSEYFRAMFGAGVSWKESSSLEVELEVQVDIMRSFVEFCYTDELPTASEYIGQLLVLSDRFLAQSLRSKCENALAIVLNTEICPKLAMSLFGFALETGAHYLASKCAKILVPNLVVLLETGGIDALGLDELEALSVFYKNEVFAQIERKMNENEEIELWDAEVLQELVKECKFVMKSPKQRRASRKISEKSELTSPNTPITPLKELSESLESSYITPKSKSRPQRTKLDLTSPKVLSPSSPKSWGEVASPRRRSGSFSLKDIIEEEAKTTTPTRPVKIKGAFTPIRRKHAKGQDMLREERERAQQAASFSPQSPWGKARPVKIPDPCIGDPFPSPSTSFHVKSPIQFSPSPTVSKTDRLDEIIRKQSAAEQNRKKVKSKSLKTINIEERAIEELKAMYAEKFPYDIITVKRAHLDVSAPVWTKS